MVAVNGFDLARRIETARYRAMERGAEPRYLTLDHDKIALLSEAYSFPFCDRAKFRGLEIVAVPYIALWVSPDGLPC